MVIGYGDNFAALKEYNPSVKIVMPSGDRFEDLADILYQIKSGKEITEFVITDSSDLGSEVEYFYWLGFFVRRNVKFTVLHGTPFPEYEEMTRKVTEFAIKHVNVKKGKTRKAKNKAGGNRSFQVHYGYERTEEGYKVNESEYKAVQYAFKHLDKGDMYQREIADNLNQMGYVTRKGNPIDRGTINGWRIQRKFYEGYEKNVDGEWELKHEAIIYERSNENLELGRQK